MTVEQREKTRFVNLKEEGAKLEFLGFVFRYDRDLSGRRHRYLNLTPSAKSVEKEKERIRELTDHHHCFQPLPEMIETINRHTAGWKGYFNFRYARQALRKINHFVGERLIRHAHRRSQRPMKPLENESYYGFFKRLGLKSL